MAARPKTGLGWSGRRWITVRQLVQGAALLAFVVLFIGSRRGGWPASLVNVPMRLDPLAVLAHLLASQVLLVGSTLALLTIGLTLVFGRAWCGWVCPLGTVLDLFSLRRWRDKRAAPPESWRAIKYGLLLIILFAALLGNLTLLVFDPLTLLFRTLSISVWPALDQLVTVGETTLYQISWLRPAIATFDGWIRPVLLPAEPVFYRYTFLYAVVFLGVILLNVLAPRFWCRYLCPLGALLGGLSKVALVRREVAADCIQCLACTRSCPTGTIDPNRGYASDSGECTMCLECLVACPATGVGFPLHLSPAARQPYDPGRRQALIALGTAVAGVGLFRSNDLARREHPRLIRPPGAQENDLLAKCIRCGECVRACPTGVIQSAVTEAGLAGLWTPLLIPRLGYCDYSCNACGQICPVEAILPLSLEDKRQQIIGLAYLDQDRCIAWADHQDCIVCEEMCPVPDKAIRLEPTEVHSASSETTIVQLPYVDRERCIGCGICEYKCPLNGEAAIRVAVPVDPAA
ncbi:MAG: 4Fe-4S binding protein [Anaerolineae bacterium]|nr:4Fe-4S binding protein [Anaerolineae bacterium]